MRRRAPDPPTDIRLHLRDGRVIPVDAIYLGVEDGQHVWQIVTTSVHIDRLEKLTMAVLPARTTIRLVVEGI